MATTCNVESDEAMENSWEFYLNSEPVLIFYF
jgi:hypothetical protein